MATSKIKSLIIYILLFVNLFLLGLLASDWLQTRRSRQTIETEVRSILADSGITMDHIRLPDNTQVKSYTLTRDYTEEAKLVSSILGRLTVQELQNGNIMYYRGEKGEASFRSTGDFEVLLTNHAVPINGDTVDTARSVLRKMGIQAQFVPELSSQTGNTYSTVVMIWEYEGLPVVNAQIQFTFTSEFLMMISGTRMLDLQREDDTFRPLDSATLLTRFVGIVSRNGYVFSELKEIRPVYLSPDSSGGKLTPLWRIETDGGTFYLNMTTGEEQPVA